MDFVTGVEGVEVLGLVEVPQHGGTVLTAGGAEGAVGGDGDGVDVAGVTDVVGLEAAGSEFPDLVLLVSETEQFSAKQRNFKMSLRACGDYLSHGHKALK